MIFFSRKIKSRDKDTNMLKKKIMKIKDNNLRDLKKLNQVFSVIIEQGGIELVLKNVRDVIKEAK